MWTALLPIIGEIVLEGMKGWNEKRRTRFKDKYHRILTNLEKAKSQTPDRWIDSEIDILVVKLEIFLKAYKTELENENTSND